VLGGALLDPLDAGLLVFRTADRGVVQDFADNDPYVKTGLVTGFTIREWMVVVGTELLDGGSLDEEETPPPPPPPCTATPATYNEWFQPAYRGYISNNPGVSAPEAFKTVAALWDTAPENPNNNNKQ
jgi:hypothetical protein